MCLKITLAPTYEAAQRKPLNFDELRPWEPEAPQGPQGPRFSRWVLELAGLGAGLSAVVWLGFLAASLLGAW